MKKCHSDYCIPTCDFCIYYNFNGNEEGHYTGNGWCSFLREPKEPYDMCENFYCNIAYREENWQ